VGSVLKVAPAELQSAAAAETAVGGVITGLAVGQLLTAAAAAMPGLQSGAACGQAATVVDSSVQAIGTEVGAHADNLNIAARSYQTADDESARRLKSAQPAG
jgi:hypothetical protein